MLTHKELKARALERAEVKAEYDRLYEEFACTELAPRQEENR